MPQLFHALTLHLHQPPNNLQLLIETNPKEAEQIIHCYDRVTRFAHRYANIAHFHVVFSGLLLQQLQQPEIIEKYRQYIDIPAMLESYRLAKNIELIGAGMYHPIFPLIAPDDWDAQLQLERDLMLELFGRAPRGFLPPEMAFSMSMIPSLVKAGYEYVLMDASNIQPEHEQLDVFKPYRATYQDASITIIPINRDISYAQQTGLDPVWFAHEVQHQAWHSPQPDAPRLLSTWSNGENKRWFRLEEEGFFGHFFAPYVEHAENGEYPVLPVSISEYLKQHAADAKVNIEAGAWNTGSTSGYGLADWGGSDAQRSAIAKLRDVRQRYEKLIQADVLQADKSRLDHIRQQILIGQSSCFIFWGDEWIQKLFEFLQPAEQQLSALETTYFQSVQSEKPQPVATPQPLVLPKKPAKKTTSSNQPIRPHHDSTESSDKQGSHKIVEPDAKFTQPVKPVAKPEVKTESKATSEAKAEPKTESKPVAKPEAKAEPKTESKPVAKPEAKAEPKTESKPVAKPEVKTEAEQTEQPVEKTDSTKPTAKTTTRKTTTRRKTTARKTTKKTS